MLDKLLSLIDANIVAALIGCVATIAATFIPIIIQNRRRKRHQQYKFVYVKVVHISRKKDDTKPLYETFVKRLKKNIDVFDEYHYFRLNVYHSPRENYTITDRTSGVVDLLLLHPWREKLIFTDKGAEKLENYVTQTVKGNSNVFFTKSMYYNGLQEGNEDIAMRMESDTDEARMIVDFSSVPGYKNFFTGPPLGCYLSQGDEECTGVAEVQPGIYAISRTKLKKDEVMKINFSIDWDAVEKQSITLSVN